MIGLKVFLFSLMGEKTEEDEELNWGKFLINCVSTQILYIHSVLSWFLGHTKEQEGVCSDVQHLHSLTECFLRLWENSKKLGRTWCRGCSRTPAVIMRECKQREKRRKGGARSMQCRGTEKRSICSILFCSSLHPAAYISHSPVKVKHHQLLVGYLLASQCHIKTVTFLIRRECNNE